VRRFGWNTPSSNVWLSVNTGTPVVHSSRSIRVGTGNVRVCGHPHSILEHPSRTVRSTVGTRGRVQAPSSHGPASMTLPCFACRNSPIEIARWGYDSSSLHVILEYISSPQVNQGARAQQFGACAVIMTSPGFRTALQHAGTAPYTLCNWPKYDLRNSFATVEPLVR
jgi:hypothetical protein